MEWFKAGVRPFIAYTGWTAIVAMGVYMAIKFANADIGLMFVTALISTGSAAVGYYLKAREVEKNGGLR